MRQELGRKIYQHYTLSLAGVLDDLSPEVDFIQDMKVTTFLATEMSVYHFLHIYFQNSFFFQISKRIINSFIRVTFKEDTPLTKHVKRTKMIQFNTILNIGYLEGNVSILLSAH